MFQGLSQGAIISLFYKNEPRVVDGRVISVNTHMPTYNPNQPMAILNGPVTDITVQVGNETIPFAGLPANGVVANFPDKGLFISDDRAIVNREVESMVTALEQDLGQVPAKQKMLASLKTLAEQSTPEKQFQAKQAKEIEVLKTQFEAMNGKFDQMVELLSAKLGYTETKEN